VMPVRSIYLSSRLLYTALLVSSVSRFPYTTLFRSGLLRKDRMELLTTVLRRYLCVCLCPLLALWVVFSGGLVAGAESPAPTTKRSEDTRLNSSHQIISYAVFCLKKTNKKDTVTSHT